MPQSLSHVILHTVFSSKERFPFFQNTAFREEVHSYLGGCAKTLHCLPIRVGGVADLVHLLTTLARTVAIADFVKEVKRVSCNWIQERGAQWEKFHWQAGYATFSVSESKVAEVVAYIENQEAHHRVQPFQEEYREFLRRHGEQWDEKYVWD